MTPEALQLNPGLAPGVSRHGLTYLARAFGSAQELLDDARFHLRGRDFDTMVGVGLSGALVVPLLARDMGKNFAIVRKESDNTHGAPVEGLLGHRWIFVDDLVASGATRAWARTQLEGLRDPSACLFVGTYTYGLGSASMWDSAGWWPA